MKFGLVTGKGHLPRTINLNDGYEGLYDTQNACRLGYIMNLETEKYKWGCIVTVGNPNGDTIVEAIRQGKNGETILKAHRG